MKTILSLLFISNLAVNNAQALHDYGYVLQYDRNIEEYKLSYIFDHMNSSGFNEYKKTVAQKILRRLRLANISHNSEVWSKLLKIESDLQTSASLESIANFNAFKTNNYYKDFDTLDSKLTERIATYNGQKTLLDPKLKKAINDSYSLVSLEKKDMKKRILAFYNFMYELFDEYLEKMSYNFEYYTRFPAGTFASTVASYQGTCLLLGKDWNNKDLLRRYYNQGQASSGAVEATFVHEFGHIIHDFLAVRATPLSNFTWDTYNTNNTGVLNPKCSVFHDNPPAGLAWINPSRVVGSLERFISQKIREKYGFTDIADFEFVSWTMMMSGYVVHSESSSEYFAEAFARWYLAPDSQKNIFWQWLHEYFTKELISQFVQ